LASTGTDLPPPASPPPPDPAGEEQAAVDSWLEANVSLIAFNK
jgi:hypothetical protein